MIEEETEIKYHSRGQLSYKDDNTATVELFIDNKYLGDIKVWEDSLTNNREYICINYTVIYLDEIRKINTRKYE